MKFIYLIIFSSFIYSQCVDYNQSQCISDGNCNWVDDYEWSNCSSYDSAIECSWANDNGGDCDWSWNSTQWQDTCSGGSFQLDTSYCEEIEIVECSEMNESECSIDQGCDWIEDIELENCNFAWSESDCQAHDGCEWECEMTWVGHLWEDVLVCDCYGQYQVDTSYCQEIEMSECSEMNESECSIDEGCDWVEDINSMSCSAFSNENCVNQEGCFLDQDCNQWGSWYSWICYDYGPVYCSGNYQQDNSYCEENQFQLGDANFDNIINVLDVIAIINLVLYDRYEEIADMNEDSEVNVLDIIEIVGIILNGDGL
tara:strand:- start:1115 stop:2053 length:939 start_codon:yes stop_codon:yes gene_type:complete